MSAVIFCLYMAKLVALFLQAGHVAPATPAIAPPPLGRMVDAGGYRVHLYCTGSGSPTVVVVSGGFSFDWGLVQPAVARFTRICTYDPSGTAWSDSYPTREAQQRDTAPGCADRVAEIHTVLKNADISPPYVLVGFSIGGLIGRLYEGEYPEDVAGMVIVDHAFIDFASDASPQSSVSSTPHGSHSQTRSTLADSVDSPPVRISGPPIALDLEDNQNFSKLPQLDQDLHRWALSVHRLRPTVEAAAECEAAVESRTKDQPYPFGDRPLIVIRTNNRASGYEELQTKLLLLSRNNKLVLAGNSSHMVIIDEPDVVIASIRQVAAAVRNVPRGPNDTPRRH
jgi:pimeloyl-ACP methyl ester carboxylesterase